MEQIGNIVSNIKLLLYEQGPKYVGALVNVVVAAEVLVLLQNEIGLHIPVNLNIRYYALVGRERSEAPH